MKVLVTNIMMLKEQKRFEEVLSTRGIKCDFPQVAQYMKEEELLSLLGDYEGWLAGDDEITRNVLLKALPKLRVISKWGTGIDSIDQKACAELGVKLFNSPGAFRDTVSEVAMAYIIDLSRQLSFIDRSVRLGSWPKPKGVALADKQLGIIGFGAIGQGLAEKALAFRMKVKAFDPYFQEKANPAVRGITFEELLKTSDYICLACNMTEENRHFINKAAFAKMKQGVYLVNVARGPLVDEKALIGALQSGKVAGAGLDVFEIEPLRDSPLLQMDQVILGSHNANNTAEAIEAVHKNTLINLFHTLGIKYS